jgi:hypothetical protein
MKKLITFLFVFALFIPIFCINTSAAEPITIWKTATSPKIDCVLEDSYQLIADSLKNPQLFKIKNNQNVKNNVQIYACWDKDYLYLYVKADCNDPHVAYQEGDHYIFNAHYLMTALCPDDSTQAKYKGTNDANGGWEWGALNSANLLYEWTTIYDSKNKTKARADHFGALGQKTGYEYDTKSEKGYDIYEQKIPMKQLTTSAVKNGLKPSKGTVFGLGTSLGFVDVGTDYKDEQQVSTNLSNYFEGKNLNKMVLCKLDSNLNEPEESEETSSAASSAASSAVSSKASTSSKTESSKAASSAAASSTAPADTTTDNGFEYWWLVATGTAVVIVAVVSFLIIKKRKQ